MNVLRCLAEEPTEWNGLTFLKQLLTMVVLSFVIYGLMVAQLYFWP